MDGQKTRRWRWFRPDFGAAYGKNFFGRGGTKCSVASGQARSHGVYFWVGFARGKGMYSAAQLLAFVDINEKRVYDPSLFFFFFFPFSSKLSDRPSISSRVSRNFGNPQAGAM
jgi:hypothetical protein